MKLLVTGANGFLGRHVVNAAVRSGHDVRAQVRPSSKNIPDEWFIHPSVEIVRCDLRDAECVISLVKGVDTTAHLAAAKTGGIHEQFASTIIGTENLLEAINAVGGMRIVCISSFSVYEYLQSRRWSILDEASPRAHEPERRDAYCQTKSIQEDLVRSFAAENDWPCVILRPGVIFGRDHLWTARLGMRMGRRWWIRIGALAPVPLTYVENCADAVVLATVSKHAAREVVLNVVDDDVPSLRAYMNALKQQTSPRPRVVPVPWMVARLLAASVWWTNKMFFQGRAKVPGMLTPTQLHARSKPLRYSNEAIKNALGWKPHYTWREGLERASNDIENNALPQAALLEEPVARSNKVEHIA